MCVCGVKANIMGSTHIYEIDAGKDKRANSLSLPCSLQLRNAIPTDDLHQRRPAGQVVARVHNSPCFGFLDCEHGQRHGNTSDCSDTSDSINSGIGSCWSAFSPFRSRRICSRHCGCGRGRLLLVAQHFAAHEELVGFVFRRTTQAAAGRGDAPGQPRVGRAACFRDVRYARQPRSRDRRRAIHWWERARR